MPLVNRRVILNRVLEGVPQPEAFELAAAPVPEPGPGELLIRHIYLSLDPYQRSVMAGRHGGATGPLGAGDMPTAEIVGQVIASRHAGFAEGDYVRSIGGWQEYSLSNGERTYRVDPARAPLSTYLGVLGMPGLTAWAGIVRLAEVRAGQVVLVSAALGPVGATVGQLAIERGAVAVGIAGSPEKCRFVTRELGFGDCVNYKAPDFRPALAAALPDGADVYFDNVGGQMLVDAFSVLRNYGTVILCGLMAQYNDPASVPGLYLGLPILKRAVMKGLVVYDFEAQRAQFFDEVAPLVASGRMRYREDRAEGIAAAGAHFCRLMRGENLGKALVVLAPERIAA